MAVDVILYPNCDGGNSSDWASTGVDVLNNDLDPQLSYNVNATKGDCVGLVDDGNLQDFKNWVIETGRSDNHSGDGDGTCHVYVIDMLNGPDSHAKEDTFEGNDRYARWNAGDSNFVVGQQGAENTLIMEVLHTIMDEDVDSLTRCPADDEHSCGEVRKDPVSHEITPMITGYAQECSVCGSVTDSCNDVTEPPDTPYHYVHDLSDCTVDNIAGTLSARDINKN